MIPKHCSNDGNERFLNGGITYSLSDTFPLVYIPWSMLYYARKIYATMFDSNEFSTAKKKKVAINTVATKNHQQSHIYFTQDMGKIW